VSWHARSQLSAPASAQGHTAPAHRPLNFPGRFCVQQLRSPAHARPQRSVQASPEDRTDPALPPLDSRVDSHSGYPRPVLHAANFRCRHRPKIAPARRSRRWIPVWISIQDTRDRSRTPPIFGTGIDPRSHRPGAPAVEFPGRFPLRASRLGMHAANLVRALRLRTAPPPRSRR